MSSERIGNTSRHADSARAYTRLREQIISCQLAPGMRITEALMAAALGVGKTPVREALLRLQSEGLVQVIPRHGYQVTPITLRDVQEICGLRLILEPAGARLAAGRIDPDELVRLDSLCQMPVSAGDYQGITALLRANTCFHLAIAAASANRQLLAITETILLRMERLFHLTLMMESARATITHDHRDLVEMLLAGNGDAASEVMTVRLQSSERMVLAALHSSPQLFSVNVAPLRLSTDVAPPHFARIPLEGEILL